MEGTGGKAPKDTGPAVYLSQGVGTSGTPNSMLGPSMALPGVSLFLSSVGWQVRNRPWAHRGGVSFMGLVGFFS